MRFGPLKPLTPEVIAGRMKGQPPGSDVPLTKQELKATAAYFKATTAFLRQSPEGREMLADSVAELERQGPPDVVAILRQQRRPDLAADLERQWSGSVGQQG